MDEEQGLVQVKVKVIKDIPKDQIKTFEDRQMYNVAVITREFTKSANAFPRETGELARQEIKLPIVKVNENAYGLLRGTEYASYVWKMTRVKWTNPMTKPKWYSTIYKQRETTIVEMATDRALKELK